MTELFRVLYCSRTRILADSTASEIDSILLKSRENNNRDGVTGGLLFSGGCFAQVLEGPIDTVEGAFERIQCDQRHSDVTVLQAGPIARRDFPSWSMAFVGATNPANSLAGLNFAEAFSGQTSAGDEVLDLLRSIVVRETEWVAPLHA